MAHVNLHLAAGVAAGTGLGLIGVARAVLAARPLAPPIAHMLVLAGALGLWAVGPSVLARLGVPGAHHAWWADLFVGHRSLDRLTDGGLLIGELALGAAIAGHYLLILLALVRARRRRPRSA